MSAHRQFSLVDVSSHDGVAVLTLNRRPVNAMSRALLDELRAALERCATDDQVRVIIIASALPSVFSAGADLRELQELVPRDPRSFVDCGQGLLNYMESMPKPIIAAVRGAAMGGGCELAMACDLRVAGQSARFAQPEVNLGIIPGWAGTQRLPRLIGKSIGLELVLTGEAISAERAFALGFVNRLVPDDQLLDEAHRIAQSLAAKPPLSLALIKQAVQQGMELPLSQGLALEAELFMQAAATPDAQEGIRAFLEKRRPRLSGQ